MRDEILKVLEDTFDITHDGDFEFMQICGFTFVFKRSIISVNDRISSAEIRPAGIIYEENDEYYFAPLYGRDNIDEIIREYVKIFREAECIHFQP